MTDYRTPDIVDNFILSDLNDVLSGKKEQVYITSERGVEVKINRVYSELTNETPDYTLPTIIFKKLAEEWKQYLYKG